MHARKTRRVLPGKVVAARLTPEEAAAFAKLLELEQAKADASGSVREITSSLLLRRLVRKAAKARGVWG